MRRALWFGVEPRLRSWRCPAAFGSWSGCSRTGGPWPAPWPEREGERERERREGSTRTLTYHRAILSHTPPPLPSF